jgi:dihydrofolate reductase
LIISLIAATDLNRGISRDNRLPWHLQKDLKRFKSLTMGHHLVMGRKTFETIGKHLPGRIMIIISRNKSYHPDGFIVASSIEEALEIAKLNHETEVFIIGGGDVFTQSIHLAHKIYLTRVNSDASADIFFPKIDPLKWKLIHYEENTQDEQNEYASTFSILIRTDKLKSAD